MALNGVLALHLLLDAGECVHEWFLLGDAFRYDEEVIVHVRPFEREDLADAPGREPRGLKNGAAKRLKLFHQCVELLGSQDAGLSGAI